MNKIKLSILSLCLISMGCYSNSILEGAISKNKNGVIMLSDKKLSFDDETIFIFESQNTDYKSFIENINAYTAEGGNLKAHATGSFSFNDTLIVQKIMLNILLENLNGILVKNKNGSFSVDEYNIIITSHTKLFINNKPLEHDHHHNEDHLTQFNDLINKQFNVGSEIKVNIIGTKFNNNIIIKDLNFNI